MGKKCPTPNLNSSISNSILTNASSHNNQNQSYNHHQHQQSSIPLPPPLPPPLPTQHQHVHQQQQPHQQHFPQKYMNSKRKHANNNYHNMLMHPGGHLDHNNYLHLNSLWSIWYGVLLTLFQGYLAVHGAYRFLGCSLISWKYEPVAELNLQVVLSGVVFILLPFFFASAVFKVGNLANDGIKLATGAKERRCSLSPHDGLEEEARGGTLRALWTHGGPTAAFVHIVIAMCLLLPRLLLEARIIENGLLPRENIWQTELDFIAVNRRNLVVLSVVNAPYQNGTNIEHNNNNSNSLEDDQDDEYYNDTMFTAVRAGTGSAATKIYNNNNLLNILSSSGGGKGSTTHMVGSKKERNNKNVGVDFAAVEVGGKTRYFEVPDLINRDNDEEQQRRRGEANNSNDDDDDDDDDGNVDDKDFDDVTKPLNNNKYDFKEEEEADTYDGRGAKGGGLGDVTAEEERIFVEHFDTKEIDEESPIMSTQSTTTTVRTTKKMKEIDFGKKNYDKMWDKLGTLGKVNSLSGNGAGAGASEMDEQTPDVVTKASTTSTTTTTTGTTSTSTSTSTSSMRPKDVATTTTITIANEYDKSTGGAVNATTTTGATRITTTNAEEVERKYASKSITSTSTTKTTITDNTSDNSGDKSQHNNNSNNNNNARDAADDVFVAQSSTTTANTPIAHTQPTRTHTHTQHHHHQQQQQQQSQSHHKEQPQTHNGHHTHAAKATRKHHRQHHRQRGGHNGRRQHNNNNNNSNIANGRSDETVGARSTRLDTGRAVADVRAVNVYRNNNNNNKPINDNELKRLDDLDMSLSADMFEQNKNMARGRNRDTAAAPSFELDAFDYDTPPRRAHTKSTSTISTTTRDSNIHIVKPEKLPAEIIPSTPLTSNSKIIEIKTKNSRSKRMTDKVLEAHQVEIEPEYLLGELAGNDSSEYLASSLSVGSSSSSSTTYANANTQNTAVQQPPQTSLVRLDGFAGMLQIFFGIEKPIDLSVFDHPPSAEFINLLFALLVWCVRYPAVFWTTTKSFATIFSVQMIAVALDIIFSYIGASNLYKLQVYSEAMPIQNPGLVLNGVVTLALFLLSSALMVASSMIMYLYGHGRLAAKMRDRSLITMKSSETWIYFAHCASLCYVLALAVVKAPLLNDLSATYKNNLHCPTFLSALISVVHVLLWIVIWLGLTAKRRWTFKLPPMDAYGITKATTQPLLMANRSSLPSAGSISGSGSNIGNSELKSSSLMSSGGGGGRGGKMSTESSTDGGTDDVYWPKLTPSSPKLKVTFNEVPSTSDDVRLIGDHEQNDGKRHSPCGTAICFASATGEIDDGEYATLRTASAATMTAINIAKMNCNNTSNTNRNANIDPTMTIDCGNETHISGNVVGLPIPNDNCTTPDVHGIKHNSQLNEYDELPPPPPQLMSHHSSATRITGTTSFGDDSNSEEGGKLLACVRDDSVTYASTRDLEPPAATTPPPPPPPPAALVGANQQSSAMNHTYINAAAAVNGLLGHGVNGGYGGVGGGGGCVSAAAAVAIASRAPQAIPENMQLSSSPEHLVSPLAPVTVTVHTNEAHIASSSTPRCLRRADSGVPNEALTPRSETTSTTESTTSPPERAPSESSSGVHSGEERDVEVVIRPRAASKPPPKPPQPPIQEEPYGRCTNMRMSSFGGDATNTNGPSVGRALNSATLPLTRSAPEQKFDYATHCSTMPLPAGCHSQQQAAVTAARGSGNYGMTTSAYSMHSQPPLPLPPLNNGLSSFRAQYANSAVAMAGANAARMQQQSQQSTSPPPPPPPTASHTTLPNGVRYSNPHFLRRLPHITKAAESPYGHLGLGAGHHTFSKLLQDPLQHSLVNTTIPEDRDSANYSMSSENGCGNLYATAQSFN